MLQFRFNFRRSTTLQITVAMVFLLSIVSQLNATDELDLLRSGIQNARRDIQDLRIEICYSHFDGSSASEANKAEKGRLTYQLGGNRNFCVNGRALALDIVKCRNDSYGFYLQKPADIPGARYMLSWLNEVGVNDSTAISTLEKEAKNAFDAVFGNYMIVGIYTWDFLEIEGLVMKFESVDPGSDLRRYSFRLDPETTISKSMELTHGELVFDPACHWALARAKAATSRKPGQYVTQEVENFSYRDGPGLMKSSVFQHFTDNKLDYYQRSEFRNLKDEVDSRTFYLSAYGFVEPKFGRRWGSWPWLLLGGIAILVFAFWVRKK
jgi:hypothetical protein